MASRAIAVIALVLSIVSPPARAEDDKLAGVVAPGEDWQVVVQDLGFADGLSNDADGRIFYSNLRAKGDTKPGVFVLSPDGKSTSLSDTGRSGTKLGPDGRTLYACGGGKIVAIALPPSGNGEPAVYDKGIQPNDLVVTRGGRIYFTETGKHQVTLYDPQTKDVKPADVGIKSPNGIGISPDGKTLIVSDYNGLSVYTFTIQPDGTLTDKKAAMTMKAPEKKPDVAGGDGLTVDSTGRAYVTTSLGVQVFSPAGELLGVLPKPQNASLVNAAFGGDKELSYLYIACGDKIYRRKMQARGVAPSMPGK
jgi:gluconolactonase